MLDSVFSLCFFFRLVPSGDKSLNPAFKDMSKITVVVDQTINEFDRGLGAFVGSSSERRAIMKSKGLVDIGPGDDYTKVGQRTPNKDLGKVIQKAAHDRRAISVLS